MGKKHTNQQKNQDSNTNLSDYEQDLAQLNKPRGFGEDEVPHFDDAFLLPEDTVIYSREMIQSYGKRVEEIRKNAVPPLTLEKMGEIAGTSRETIRNIINGNEKTVNCKIFNRFAKHFRCSAHYLLGLTNDKNSTSVDNKMYKLPLLKVKEQEFLNVIMAGQWARIDPELFYYLEPIFHLDAEKRHAIKIILSQFSKN